MSEYLRQMPSSEGPLVRQPSVARQLHIAAPLLVLLGLLTAYGLLVLYSASGQSEAALYRQGRFFAVGYVAMIVVAQFSPVRWSRWSPWGYLLGTALLVAVIFAGDGAKGAQRWQDLGCFRIQPSEIKKLAVPKTDAW